MPERRKSLNILYVGTLPPHPGGSAISGSQILVGLAQSGHTIRALAPITPEAIRFGDAFAQCHPEIGVTRHLVPHFFTTPYIPSSDEYRRLEQNQIQDSLSALIADKRPDIIFIGRETFAWQVPEIARAYSLPSIMRVAGGTTLGLLNSNYPESMVQQLLAQFRRVNLLITPADHLARSLRQLGIQNIKTVLNAVDLEQFFPRSKDGVLLWELVIRDDETIIVYVANLHQRKRPLDVVAAAEEALRHNSNLVFVIVGDGLLREAMEDACREKNIAERFRFVGWVDYHRVPDYINLADMVVLPSDGEGLARVYLETQACGRLLLASDIPPAREVIEDGETGLLFRVGDVKDLSDKVLLAADDPDLRAEIGRKARERVRAHSLKDAVAAYEAILENIAWPGRR